MNELYIKVPFVFSSKLDNKNVVTVGDQMLAEHVFAYHQNLSWKKGSESLFSEIEADYKFNTITIKEQRETKSQTGEKFDIKKNCDSIKESFKGTLHAQYGDLVKNVSCEDKIITITFTAIPNNWRSLFASPDFAITDGATYTGPYYIHSSTNQSAHLKINKNYPKELRANEISDVRIEAYAANETDSVVKLLDPEKNHATFLYGHVLKKSDLDSLRSKKFNLQIYQSEWLVYVGYTEKIVNEDRAKVTSYLNSERSNLQKFSELGFPAYSMAPSDRVWGLDSNTYNSLQASPHDMKLKKKYSIATLDEWAKLPLFAEILQQLKNKFQLEVRLYPRKEMGKIYGEGGDLFLSPMGVSPDDPIGHLFFFASYSDEYTRVINGNNELQRIATLKDSAEFNNALKEVEKRVIKNNLIVPLFHYPSIVAESPLIQKDPTLSWDWGIQAWTYQVR